MFDFAMMEKGYQVMNKILALTDEMPEELKVALLGVMFDHICETEHLDKKETLNEFSEAVEAVNKIEGSMYP